MRDRTVGVVGGGDSALQEALTLADAVGEVIVLHRGDELTAQAAYREPALAHPKISVRYGTVVEEILGEDAVSGVRTRDVASGDTRDLELGGLFIYVGLAPNSDYLRDLVELDDDGRIPTDANMQTELAGVFAAGIVRRGSLGQAAISAGEGAAAAKAAHRHLGGEAAGRAIDTGGRGRPRQRRLTWLRSSPSTIPRGFPPAGHRQAARPAPAEPRGPDALPRRLPVRQLRGLRRPAARVVLRAHARRGRSSASQPRESWVDDPEMCAAIQAGRGRRRPGGGSLKHL